MSKKTKPPKGPKPTDNNSLRSGITKALTFKLTKDDKASFMDKSAEYDAQIADFEKKKKDSADNFNAKIKELEEKRLKISGVVRAGEESRTVKCVEERDYAGNAVRYFFNGVLMEERLMTVDERQRELSLKGKQNGPSNVTTLASRRTEPGPGKPRSFVDHKKRAAGDKDDDDAEAERLNGKADLEAVISSEKNKNTKHSSVDGARDDDK